MPLAVAQHAGMTMEQMDNTVVVTDGEKDVQIYAASRLGGPTQNASQTGSNFDHLDLLKIVFNQETESDFKITVQFKTLVSSIPLSTSQRNVFFAYGKVNWRVGQGQCQRNGGPGQASASMGCLSGQGGGQRGFKAIPLEVKANENSWVFTIPKTAIFNENRVPARFGDSLTNISAGTSQFLGGFPGQGGGGGGGGGDPTGGVYAADRAPNDGFGAAFMFMKGSTGHGHLGLTALEPVRVSNGEATTIVYKVDITNHNTLPMSVELGAKIDQRYLNEGWTVRVPSLLKLEPSSTLTFPVVLALPFTHRHGETALFKVQAQAINDANSNAQLDLGVFWTDVPQPSAHHEGPDMGTWFHSGPAGSGGFGLPAVGNPFSGLDVWMNGVADDPNPEATDANVPASFNEGLSCVFFRIQQCQVPPQNRASWQIPLSPSLLLGLDYDVARQGRMVFDLIPKVPSSTAKVGVLLEYCDPTQQSGGGNQGRGGNGDFGNQTCYNYKTLLGKGEASQALTVNTPNHFEVMLTMEPAADYIPYRRGANIRIEIILTTDTPQNLLGTDPRPEFVTDKALLQQPLIEYHDPVDQAFENVGALSLVANSPFEKLVNPGKTTTFNFDVKNTGKDNQLIRLELQGVNSDWARIVGPVQFGLTPGAVRNVTIAVAAPGDAQDKERAELFFVAQNEKDASIVAVTRLRTTVAITPDIPDEAGMIAQAKSGGTPGFGLDAALLAVALVGVVAARRRRS
jgi:hypothetical protein